jgi:hypothetical protein
MRPVKLFFRASLNQPGEDEIRFFKEIEDWKKYRFVHLIWHDPNAIKFESPEEEARMLSETG